MTPDGNAQAPLFSSGKPGTLKLVFLLALAIMMMLADRQRGFLDSVRERLLRFSEPVYRLAALPAEFGRHLRFAVQERSRLDAENQNLRELLVRNQSELLQLRAAAAAAGRMQALEQAAARWMLEGTLVRIIDLDLDPFRHRFLLDRGADAGLTRGDGLMDAAGVVGQVSAVGPGAAFAILITDPSHALPVEVSRTGLKSIAYGSGEVDRLRLPNLPLSVDLEVGDRLLTTAVGGRFPAGLPVAEVIAVERPGDAPFAIAWARPLSALARNRELLAFKPSQWEGPPP